MSSYRIVILVLFFITITIGIIGLSKAATFEYKNGLTIEAPDYKTAAKLCFKKLNPVYTTEEAGLNAIYTCTNPVKGEVK